MTFTVALSPAAMAVPASVGRFEIEPPRRRIQARRACQNDDAVG
jgi:hypothetical protein